MNKNYKDVQRANDKRYKNRGRVLHTSCIVEASIGGYIYKRKVEGALRHSDTSFKRSKLERKHAKKESKRVLIINNISALQKAVPTINFCARCWMGIWKILSKKYSSSPAHVIKHFESRLQEWDQAAHNNQ